MKQFLRFTSLVVLIFVLTISAINFTLRQFRLPEALQKTGFGWCDGSTCLTKTIDFRTLTQNQIPLGWVVAWLGVPCTFRVNSAGSELRYPTAYVYARSQSDMLRYDDIVYSIIFTPPASRKECTSNTSATDWIGLELAKVTESPRIERKR